MSINGEPCDFRQITGIEAMAFAMATLSVSTETPLFVSGYPVAPVLAILRECQHLSDYGIQLFQAEDEVAAINACLEAAAGGKLALTCTSGLDLNESFDLTEIRELPLVLIDMQPEKIGQSDLLSVIYARHGGTSLPILAARSPSDCFYTLIEAFVLAIEYKTPVIVLMDAYLANGSESWKIPDPAQLHLPKIKADSCRYSNKNDEGLSDIQHPPHLSTPKIADMVEDYASIHIEGDLSATLLLVGWGSTYNSLRSAVAECHKLGLAIALLHLRHLNPLPEDLGGLLQTFEKVLVVELNSGQLCSLLRAEYLIDAKSLSQCNGHPFSIHSLVQAIQDCSTLETAQTILDDNNQGNSLYLEQKHFNQDMSELKLNYLEKQHFGEVLHLQTQVKKSLKDLAVLYREQARQKQGASLDV